MKPDYDKFEDFAYAGITVFAILLIMLMLSSHCRAQSIGLDLSVHNDGTRQYGLAVSDVSHCFGGYYNRIIKEGINADHMMNRGVCDFEGWTAGVIYSTNYEHLSFLSFGAGHITESRYNCQELNKTERDIFEAKAGLILCRWCDIVCGVSSYPAIISGVRLIINL